MKTWEQLENKIKTSGPVLKGRVSFSPLAYSKDCLQIGETADVGSVWFELMLNALCK